MQNHVDRVRELARALPGASERDRGDDPEFTIGGLPVCVVRDDRAERGRIALWCASPPGIPDEMVGAEPERFFHPHLVHPGAPAGWLGVFLDGSGDDSVDWDEIAAMLDDAHLTVTGGPTGASGADLPNGSFGFASRLWIHSGEGAWHFATVPPAVATAIDDLHEEGRRGFGSRRVEVTIGGTTWRTSIFPDAATTSYVLPVKKAVRTAEGVGEGDHVDVVIELVDRPDSTH